MQNPYLAIVKQAEKSEDQKRIASLQRQLAQALQERQIAMNFIHDNGLDAKFFEETDIVIEGESVGEIVARWNRQLGA